MRIVYNSYNGRYSDNPRAIYQGLLARHEFQFEPQVVTVEAGTTLGWTNEDSAPHRIVAEDGAFTSEDLAQGDQFTTFAPDGEGEYPYVCGIHPQMRGTIVVE